MTTDIVLLAAFALLSVNAGPFDCDKDGKCGPGMTCEDGSCVLRTDCPMLSMPRLKSGCIMLTVVDERDCPMPNIVCSKENLRCGTIYCKAGYECNRETTTCIPRRDCPNLILPKQEGCTDEMTLDEYDCLVPVRTCKTTQPPLRQKRQGASAAAVKCPRNAEHRECTDICPPKTCANYLRKSACFSLRCGSPKCVCKEGHVQLSSNIEHGCVPRETCVKMDSLKNKTEQNEPKNPAPSKEINADSKPVNRT